MCDRDPARLAVSRHSLSLVAFAALLAACAPGDEHGEGPPLPGDGAQDSADRVGEVSFPVSCSEEVQSDFDRAVALLHSFEFEESRGVFASIASGDPDCAMAHWGVAMTYYHPLWAPPTQRDLELGREAVEKAQALARPDAIFMHDLPVHRGEETVAEVIEGPQSVVFDQAENRLHVQQALMATIMEKYPMSDQETLRPTKLDTVHRELGGKMVPCPRDEGCSQSGRAA